jgi:hypothetical protein
MKIGIAAALVTALLAVSSCSAPESLPRMSPEAVSFVNRVWVVAESRQIAAGELRVFLSDGTMVMASPQATPALGAWTIKEGRFVIVEDGLNYDAEILELTADTFRIRIHSPGEPVEIRFVPAETPLPAALSSGF